MGVEIQENVLREAVNYACVQTDWAAAAGTFSQASSTQCDFLSMSLPNLTIQGEGKNLTVGLQGAGTAGGTDTAKEKPPAPQGPPAGDRGETKPKGEGTCGYASVDEMRRERDLRTKNFLSEPSPPGAPPRWGFSPSFANQPGFAGNAEANGYPPTNFENKPVQTDQGYTMLVSQKVNADGQVQTRTSEFPNCPNGVSMVYDRQNADGTVTRERYDNVKRITCERQADGSYTTTLTMLKDGKETTATIRTAEDGRWIDDKTGQPVEDRHSPGYLRHMEGEARLATEANQATEQLFSMMRTTSDPNNPELLKAADRALDAQLKAVEEAGKRPLLSPEEKQAYEARKAQLQQAKANPTRFLQQTGLELRYRDAETALDAALPASGPVNLSDPKIQQALDQCLAAAEAMLQDRKQDTPAGSPAAQALDTQLAAIAEAKSNPAALMRTNMINHLLTARAQRQQQAQPQQR